MAKPSQPETVGALDGIRVVDFGQYVAGPLVAMMLADEGAEVIRIDPRGGPRWRSSANAVLQRGKRSIVLDLHDVGEREVGRSLIARADVVVEGFRPGVMARFGLDYEHLAEAHPRLIYCSLPADGSSQTRPGYSIMYGIGRTARGWSSSDRLFSASDRWLYVKAPSIHELARATGAKQPTEAAVEARFLQEAAAMWVRRLRAAGIAAHELRTTEENMEDETVRRRGLSVWREHAGLGRARGVGPGPRMSRTPVRLTTPAPAPGRDTRQVLSLAGVDRTYEQLAAQGVVADELDPNANLVHL